MKKIYYYIREGIFHNQLSKLDYLCRVIAVASAMIGLLFLLTFMLCFVEDVAACGFFFMCYAAMLNAFFVSILIIYYFFVKEKRNKKDVLISIGVMLANIPLAAICAALGIFLLDNFKHGW
jgi:hypothetical protein